MNEQVVLVDKDDQQIGLMDKLAAHRGTGTLHRAISVLLYRERDGKKELLLQQRSKDKPLWPLFWTNTVCTHPRAGETYEDCAVRRLREEMGIKVNKADLKFVYQLLYQTRYNDQLSEYELDHLFVGQWDGEWSLNLSEAMAARWIKVSDLYKELSDQPGNFTPWVHLLMKENKIKETLA